AFDGLPHVSVEALLGGPAVHRDLGVGVALTEYAALALLNVGGSPGAVEVVQGDRATLDVGAGAHGLGGADQDGDVAVAGVSENRRLVAVVLGFLHEADLLSGHACGGEAVAEVFVGVVVAVL